MESSGRPPPLKQEKELNLQVIAFEGTIETGRSKDQQVVVDVLWGELSLI